MCPHESPGRLLESVSNYRSRWMVISLAIARQNPAYRATLLRFNSSKSVASVAKVWRCSKDFYHAIFIGLNNYPLT